MENVYTTMKFIRQEEILCIYYNHNYVNNAKKVGWQEIHQTINRHFL